MLSITEVAQRTGLQSSALRYYERAGLIEPRARVGGRRHYDASVLHTLAVIRLLREVGFTISEIGQLLDGGDGKPHWRRLAEGKLREIDAHIARTESARELLAAALLCDCANLERCDMVAERHVRTR